MGGNSPSPAPSPFLSPSRVSTIIIGEAAGIRAGADAGPWSGFMRNVSASGAGRGGRGFSYPSTCINIDVDTDLSFSFSLSLPISKNDDSCSGFLLASLRFVVAVVATILEFVAVVVAVVPVIVLVAVIASAGVAIAACGPLVLSSASSAAHLARTRAATSSAALSLRRRGCIELAELQTDPADDVALLRLLPGSTVA